MGYVINRPEEAAMRRLLAANPTNALGAVLRLAWLQGLTREEIVGLTWAEVDMEQQELRLPDRSIPLYEDMGVCLMVRMQLHGMTSEYVVISDKFQTAMHLGSVSRLVRQALDSQGQTAVRLVDLRHDFIIRRLETEDWARVVRLSGLSVPTFQTVYAGYIQNRAPGKTQVKGDDEYRIWQVLQAEKNTAVGLALWLRWQCDLQLVELVDLTWDQVDFAEDKIRLRTREVDIPSSVRTHLLAERQRRTEGEDPHVLLTPNSRRPMELSYLSKCMRTILIRGGVEDLTFRNVHRTSEKEIEKLKITALARQKNGLGRADVTRELGLTNAAAYARLKELVEEGALVKVYAKYYLPGVTVPLEDQEAVLGEYLREHGSASLDDIAFLLRLEKRQCARILKQMAAAGTLRHEGKGYALP